MAKLLLLIALVALALWMFKSRSRQGGASQAKPPEPASKPAAAAPMLACAHCGVHLPQADALADAAGRAYCTESHRLAGPRREGE